MVKNNLKGAHMRYVYVIPALCLFGTISLHATEDKLGSILQQSGEAKVLSKPVKKQKTTKKQSRFVFKDAYHANGIGQIDKSQVKSKSKSYDYENKSRFKFKFNDGSQQSNLVGGYGSGGMAGSMGGSAHGFGGGSGGKGRR